RFLHPSRPARAPPRQAAGSSVPPDRRAAARRSGDSRRRLQRLAVARERSAGALRRAAGSVVARVRATGENLSGALPAAATRPHLCARVAGALALRAVDRAVAASV